MDHKYTDYKKEIEKINKRVKEYLLKKCYLLNKVVTKTECQIYSQRKKVILSKGP